MDGIEFFPVEKKEKYVPDNNDIDTVIETAKPEDKEYIWVIRDTAVLLKSIEWNGMMLILLNDM
jgi:hypothetical protein